MNPDKASSGWSASAQQEALSKVRQAMASAVGLLPVAEAAALTIRELMMAAEVGVILLDDGQYWDVVEIRNEPSDLPRFPVNSRYPVSEYPIATERLMAGKGYFSGEAVDEILIEYRTLWPEISIGSIMGVPIIAMGQVHGEVFLVRDEQTPGFDRDDLDFAADVATLLGARLPALLSSYAESESIVGREAPLPGLAERLVDHLDEGDGRSFD